MLSPLQALIDQQDTDSLRDFLADNPDLDLNHVTATGVSALWWALNPPRGKAISRSIVCILIETNRVDPTQTWYGQKMVYACREDHITMLLETYEANYVQQRNNWGNGAGRLAAMAADGQNTHDPLVVKQYDTYS